MNATPERLGHRPSLASAGCLDYDGVDVMHNITTVDEAIVAIEDAPADIVGQTLDEPAPVSADLTFPERQEPQLNEPSKDVSSLQPDTHTRDQQAQAQPPSPGTQRRRHVCDICGKSFTRSTLRNKHRTIHSSARPFACTIDGCTQMFKHQNERTRHQSSQHGQKQFVCGDLPDDDGT